MHDKIIAYIRQYHDIYTREGITANLIKEGYSEADITAAFKQLGDEIGEPKSRDTSTQNTEMENGQRQQKKNERWWYRWALGLFVGCVVIPFVGFVIIAGIFFVALDHATQYRYTAPSLQTAIPLSTSILPFATPAYFGNNRGNYPGVGFDNWAYEGQAGEVLTIQVNADIPAQSDQIVNANGFNPWALVWSPDDTQLQESDDRSYDPRYTDDLIEDMVLPLDGTYLINVSAYHDGSSGAYTLIIESNLHPTATPESDSTPSHTPTP